MSYLYNWNPHTGTIIGWPSLYWNNLTLTVQCLEKLFVKERHRLLGSWSSETSLIIQSLVWGHYIRERLCKTLNDVSPGGACYITSAEIIRWSYVDFVARSRYLKQGYVIASHSILWDAITYPCLRYLLLATKSLYIEEYLIPQGSNAHNLQ